SAWFAPRARLLPSPFGTRNASNARLAPNVSNARMALKRHSRGATPRRRSSAAVTWPCCRSQANDPGKWLPAEALSGYGSAGRARKKGSVLRRIGLSGGLDRRASFMVLIHGAYTAANLLAGTFLSIFLWRASHNLVPIAIYSGLSALMIPAAFVANGWVWRGLGAGASIRLGLFGNGFVYLL